MLARIWPILRQRCPRCCRGPVFRGLMSMRERCPTCDYKFEREPGYFFGAIYASYFFGLVSTFYWLPMLLAGVSPIWVIGIPLVHLVLQTPLTFRYARVAWMHVDYHYDEDKSEKPFGLT
ncbi:MAG: DUF983 domain-containing protein [Dehalococcoidia bacterium]